MDRTEDQETDEPTVDPLAKEENRMVQQRRLEQINVRIKYMPDVLKNAIKEKISAIDLGDTDEDTD